MTLTRFHGEHATLGGDVSEFIETFCKHHRGDLAEEIRQVGASVSYRFVGADRFW